MKTSTFASTSIVGLALLFAGMMITGTAWGGYTMPASENNGQVRYLYPSADTEADFYAAQTDLRNNYGGGTIVFTSGTYTYSWIEIKADIHVRFKPGVTIYLTGNNAKMLWFNVGANNSSVEGLPGADMPKIFLPEQISVFGDIQCHAIGIGSSNFKVKNLEFYTRGSWGNIIGIGGDSGMSGGLIENVHSIAYTKPLHPGWSLIQAAVCANLTVRNISADGGYTLRLEQDLGQVGTYGLRNIYAEDIVNYNGRGAVVIVPNGGVLSGGNQNITIKKVRSYSSSWGLCVGDKTYNGDLGTYQNTTVSDVECHYGLDSQFRKYPEYSYLPADQLALATDMVQADFIEFMNGPSLGVVFNSLSWCTVTGARGYDFPASYNIANSAASTANPFGFSPNADVYVRSGIYLNTNFGAQNKLACSSAGGDHSYESYLKFNFSNLPDPSADVSKVILRLKCAGAGGGGNIHTVYFVSDDAWKWSEMIWNTKPARGVAMDSSLQPVVAGQWIEFDVTEQAITEKNGDGKFSVVIVSSGGNYVTYHSDEAAAADRPQLVVTIEEPWTNIQYDNFESGLGNWTVGSEGSLYTGGTYAAGGSNALDLQDNNENSVATTANLALSGYETIQVDFDYACESMDDNSEDFWLQISTDGGATYTTVEEWNLNDEFVNNQFYYESVTIFNRPLSNQTRLRFRCDASGNADDVYLDNINVFAQ
ncbi:CBM96 family carbohydrate-binding protein [Pontiella sulfatireligans]|uniref:Iota-carrageenase n=1 Tax=Pontiella sulfatireligans TaxID=2750658 RepID=A0A6C2UG07_9BACT|nr:DNRLRE domain-containing protein [Pontiella sulfatireligans]VGO18849.1 Iota-carrageenase [Pontiella sulfatireligans]